MGESRPNPGPPGPGTRREVCFPQRLGPRQPVRGHGHSPYLADHGKRGPRGNDGAKKVKGRKRQILTDTGGRLLKAFVHPANEHDKRGGQALLLGMDLSLWPRVRKLSKIALRADRGLGVPGSCGTGFLPGVGDGGGGSSLRGGARGLGAGRRGDAGDSAGEWVQAFAQAVGGGADLCLAGAKGGWGRITSTILR